jgi:hypothetical protein
VIGEVQAIMAGRVLRLHPGRRVVTVALKGVGSRRSYSGAYVSPAEQLAPVTDPWTKRQIGRVVKVDPVAGGGAEVSMVVNDDAWHSLAAGTAKVDALVAFTSNLGGDPVDGRPVRIEIS